MAGFFISIEGVDGAGKTVQSNLLKNYLDNKGFNVLLVREPGSTQIGEKIRDILLDSKQNICSETEALLYSAARAQLVREVIKPALKDGAIIISDRFIDSSLAYQGVARRLGIEKIKRLNLFATKGLLPDITFILSIEPKEAIKRKKQNKFNLDRIESERIEFHQKIYEAYLLIAKKYPERVEIIDATLKEEEIHKKIVNAIENLFKGDMFNFKN